MNHNEIEIIRAKAPMRFDLAGGYTDVAPFREIEGGNVVNTALEKYAFVDIKTRSDNEIHLYSKDMNVYESFTLDETIANTGPMRLLKATLTYVLPKTGAEITTFVDAPVGSGLGASASLAVALLGALKVLNKEIITPKNLAEDALYIENILLNNINGGQDQYAAALGGIHFFTFNASDVGVETLKVSPEIIDILQKRSLLVHSGQTRISGDVLDKVMSDYMNGNNVTVRGLNTLKSASSNIRNMLLSGDITNFGKELSIIYDAQKNLHEKIETPVIKEIFKTAKQFGVKGGKIAGAGGGGGVYLYSNEESIEKIDKALSAKGFETSPFLISNRGFQYTTK